MRFAIAALVVTVAAMPSEQCAGSSSSNRVQKIAATRPVHVTVVAFTRDCRQHRHVAGPPGVHALYLPSSARQKTDDSSSAVAALRCRSDQNCSVVLQSAIDAAAAAGSTGRLRIAGRWPVLPISLRSNVALHLAADATIIAQRGAFHGGADHLLELSGVHNVSIRGEVGGGSQLMMRKSDYTNTALYTHSEGRHALYIVESQHVRVSDIEIIDPGGDSVYLGGSVGGGPATDVELLRVVSRNAYRNGLSITGARDVVVRSCSFLNTSGTPPEAGIDIEPNDPQNWIHNISFFDLQSRWNRGSGISLALSKLSCERKRKHPCKHPAECVCPKDPQLVTIAVAGAQIQGASEMGLNTSTLVQGLDFNIGIFIGATSSSNGSQGWFNFSDVSVNETVQPGLEFEDKAALSLPTRFSNCSWSHVATAKTVRWGGQNVPLLLHQADYGAIGGISFDDCFVSDGVEKRPWLKCDSCRSRGPALAITGHVTVDNSGGCHTENVAHRSLSVTCEQHDDSVFAQKTIAAPEWVTLPDYDCTCGCPGLPANNTPGYGCTQGVPQLSVPTCQQYAAKNNYTAFAFQTSAKPYKNGTRQCWLQWGTDFAWLEPKSCPPSANRTEYCRSIFKGVGHSGDTSGCLKGKVKNCKTDDDDSNDADHRTTVQPIGRETQD